MLFIDQLVRSKATCSFKKPRLLFQAGYRIKAASKRLMSVDVSYCCVKKLISFLLWTKQWEYCDHIDDVYVMFRQAQDA